MLTMRQEKKLGDLFRAFDADTDGDGRIGIAEWLAFHDQFLSSSDAFERFHRRTAGFMFALIDRDGDGKVDLKDHRDLLRAVRVELGPWADANLRAADTDGDGLLDYAEVAAVLRDFNYSNDPTIPASSWLGPVA